MTPDEVAEIFTAANAAYESVSGTPTYTDIDKFDEKINTILVEIPRDHDGDEYGMLYLSQDPNEYSTITSGSTLEKIGKITAYDDSIDSSSSEADRKKAEASWKVKLNDSKVEAAAERGAKKMLLSTFKDTYTNKLKHPIKIYAGVSYYLLIQHLRKNYRKLHQLNISELLSEMSSYFDINEGFARYLEKMKEAQKIAATVDKDLINNATLLRMGIEAMYECGLFEKALDEWEELSSSNQNWDVFQFHFQDAEEKFNLKKKIHDKKGGLGQANLASEENYSTPYEEEQFEVSKLDTYLDNLAAAATQEKDVLEKLVNNNTNLITQLTTLTSKFEQLSNQQKGSNSGGNSNGTPTLNGKKMQFIKYNKNGYCHSHGYRCTGNHSSMTCLQPGPNHKKEATRENTMGGSTQNQGWTCSYYEENGFWVPRKRS